MKFKIENLKSHTPPASTGVYTDVASLVALQHQARGFSFLPRQPLHSLLAGRHASRFRGRGLNFEEVRRYIPGDDIRQIDWKVTARMRKAHTRIYTEERERTTLLIVDQRQSMFFGSVRAMKSVVAAECAAIAAWRVISQKDRVGALVFNDTRVEHVRPMRSRGTVMRIIGKIVEQNCALNIRETPQANPSQFNAVLRRCENLAKHDYLVIIISDASGHDEETRSILTRIARHNDLLFAFIHDPLEAALPDAGLLMFGNGTTQLELETHDSQLRKTYADAFAATRDAGRKFLLSRETPVLPLSTAEGVSIQLRRYLGARLR